MPPKKKAALVLSGGGALGAYQMAAERAVRKKYNLEYVSISGVSVGALNGALLAMNEPDTLWDLWQGLKRRDITRWPAILDYVLLALGVRKGFASNQPLARLIAKHDISPEKFEVPFCFGTVNLTSGAYNLHGVEDFTADKLLASSSMPVMWPPVNRHYVDGGLRNMTPIGDALKASSERPDVVVVINCQQEELPATARPKHIISIAKRTVQIVFDEILQADMSTFKTLNHVLAQSSGPVFHPSGRELRAYDYISISPQADIGTPLDFSQEAIRRRTAIGFRDGNAAEIVSPAA